MSHPERESSMKRLLLALQLQKKMSMVSNFSRKQMSRSIPSLVKTWNIIYLFIFLILTNGSKAL